jgi:hypothetical protein
MTINEGFQKYKEHFEKTKANPNVSLLESNNKTINETKVDKESLKNEISISNQINRRIPRTL